MTSPPRSWNVRTRVPLVLHLHGGGGSPQNSIDTTPARAEALRRERSTAFALEGTPIASPPSCTDRLRVERSVVPSLPARTSTTSRSWTSCIRSLEQSLPVDADRVVMSGHSNGAMMAWRFACERGGVLAAAMPVSGSLEIADPASCAPRGTSLLAVHGDADRNHPLEGGTGTRSVWESPTDRSPTRWPRTPALSGCRARSTVSDQTVTTTSRYRGGRRGVTVTSVVLHGADHPWPGANVSGVGIQGTPFPDWSATDVLVALVAGTS